VLREVILVFLPCGEIRRGVSVEQDCETGTSAQSVSIKPLKWIQPSGLNLLPVRWRRQARDPGWLQKQVPRLLPTMLGFVKQRLRGLFDALARARERIFQAPSLTLHFSVSLFRPVEKKVKRLDHNSANRNRAHLDV
jgi:hypothetical protein